MSVPLATTLITVKGTRPQSTVDPDAAGYDAAPPADTVIATDVRASITLPTGARGNRTADEIDSYRLSCDVFSPGLSRYDTVVDQTDSREYEVVWVAESLAKQFGLTHIKAKLQLVKGVNSGGETDEFARD